MSQSPVQQESSPDFYLELRSRGFSDAEIQDYMSPRLIERGYSDQEINAYFNQHKIASGEQEVSAQASLGAYFEHGLQGSVSGLWAREKMPDAVNETQMNSAGWADRLFMGVGQIVGDIPALVAGGVAGSLGGPAAPVTIPASAMATTEGLRTYYTKRIADGHTEDFIYLSAVPDALASGAKGAVIGGLTGGAGKLAGLGATAAGLGSVGTGAATVAAEVATMPTAGAALEGRLPHPQEFVDAGLLVVTLHGISNVRHVQKIAQETTPKIRDIYAKIGKTPEEIAQAAQTDPTVQQDILAINRDIPGAFAEETKTRLIRNEDVPSEELQHYLPRNWAKAELLERAGPEAVKEGISQTVAKAFSGETPDRLHWNMLRKTDAAKLSADSGITIPEGMVHSIDSREVRHAMNEHGNPAIESARGQEAIVPEDYLKIPDVVKGYDSVTAITTDKGFPGLMYKKQIDGSVYVVEELRTGRKELAFLSLWKGNNKEKASPSLSPETTAVGPDARDAKPSQKSTTVDDLNISSVDQKVNPDTLQNFGGGTRIPTAEDKPVLPESALNHADSVPLSGVVQALADALEVPIRTGKMGPSGRKAEGIYKITPEVIRTRTANDVATVVHEAGHHIQKQLFGDISAAPLRAFRDELAPIATKPRSGQSALPEGFAEFVAKYVVDPKDALESAPRFYEHFEKLLVDRAPDFGKALLNAREAVKRWADQPAAQEVLSHISIEGREGEGLISRLTSKDTWDKVYTNFVDRLYPLKKATAILAEGKDLPADINPYTLARTFAGAKGKATHFIEHSPFTYGNWENVGKPLAETLRAVENLDEFRAYLVSRRGLELEGRGIKSGIRPEAMRATAEKLNEKYEPLARELDEYQNHVVNYLVDSGLLGAETAAAMREMNQNYVPFFRVMENVDGFLGGGKSLTGRNPIRRIKGSGRDIIDPLESIIKNTYAMIEAAEKNGIGRALTDLASKTDGAGWLVEKLPTPKAAVQVRVEDVSKAFIDSLGPINPSVKTSIKALAESADMGEMLTFWQNAATLDKKSQIAVFRDGKREVYQAAPEIAEVMNGLNTESVPLLVKLISIPAKMLRAGATLTPDFMVRNLIRDAVSTGVLSRTGFIPGLDTAKGLKRAVTKDNVYWDWVKAGGDQASLVSMDRTTLQTTLKDIAATGYTEHVWNVVKNPLELLRLGSELSEKMTRLGEFGKGVQKHGNDKAGLMQAAYESRDIMDFSRRGKLTASFNLITAFFNASLQGLDRTARGAVENPRRFLVRTALFIGIPSILNAINNYGDNDVAEVPRAQRDMFWITPIGQGENKVLLRIPKPFEQGVMFGSTLERATEFILDAAHGKYGSVDTARQEAFRGLGKSMLDVSAPNLVPTAFAPIIEAFANRSLPFDRPIIPKNREGLLPEYQYTNNTTELTKALSSFVGTLPPVREMNTFSPARAENYIRGWTGGLGMYALQAVDAMSRKAGIVADPVKPAATLADVPFVRAFVIRHPSMGAESIQRFFDNYDEATGYLKSINALSKDFKYDDVANLLPYSVYQAVDGPHKALSEITKTIDFISKAPDMTPDEKRQMIDSMYFQAIEIARFGNQVFEALQDDVEKLKGRAERQ